MFYWNLLYYLIFTCQTFFLIFVLILVLLELTLLQYFEDEKEMIETCFNPCFIGTYSITFFSPLPCVLLFSVLILVLLELTLLLRKIYRKTVEVLIVLILVLLELTLLLNIWIFKLFWKWGFNPCFIGTYSITTSFFLFFNLLFPF